MAVTGKNKYFQSLYGRRGKRYSGLSPLVPDYALEAGETVFDDWMLDVAAPSGNTATIQSFSDDSSAEFIATPVSPGTNATIDARGDDSTSAFTATVATNANIAAFSDSTSGAFVANVATNATITAFSDDSTAEIIATPVSAGTNATITSFSDDSFASFIATVTGQPANGGAIIQNLRRHTERYKRRMEAEEKATQEAVTQQLNDIVAATPKPSNALKAAYKAVRMAKDDLDNAKLRLMAYLAEHEQEMKEEMAIIQLIAELL